MELQVLETKGISSEHILSIRSGTTRKQVSASQEQAICFPAMPENMSSMKIDVMAPVGSARTQVKPKDAEYTINIDPANKGDPEMKIRFAVKEAPQHMGKPNGDLRPISAAKSPNVSPKAKGRLDAALGAREYLDEHNLFLKVQEMLAYVINEKPEDPYDFMMDYLARQKPKKPEEAPKKASEEDIKAKLGSGFIQAMKTGVLSRALEKARPSPAIVARVSEEALKAKLQRGLTEALAAGDLSRAMEKARTEEALKAKLQRGLTEAAKSGVLSHAFAANAQMNTSA